MGEIEYQERFGLNQELTRIRELQQAFDDFIEKDLDDPHAGRVEGYHYGAWSVVLCKESKGTVIRHDIKLLDSPHRRPPPFLSRLNYEIYRRIRQLLDEEETRLADGLSKIPLL